MRRSLEVRRLGRVAYSDALELQKELEAEVIARREKDYLLLLEHPHTFTIGRRSNENGVLATAELLKTLGVEVFDECDRLPVGVEGVDDQPILTAQPGEVQEAAGELEPKLRVLGRRMCELQTDLVRLFVRLLGRVEPALCQ